MAGLSFPGPRGPGPIEAGVSLGSCPYSMKFPGPRGPGPIEAPFFLAALVCASHFRDRAVPAPLKPSMGMIGSTITYISGTARSRPH